MPFLKLKLKKLHQLLLSFFQLATHRSDQSVAVGRMLAPLCHYAREDVLRAISNEQSNLAQLAHEWRNYLFPDADNAKFADAYAQTLTYALLLARLNGEARLTTEIRCPRARQRPRLARANLAGSRAAGRA